MHCRQHSNQQCGRVSRTMNGINLTVVEDHSMSWFRLIWWRRLVGWLKQMSIFSIDLWQPSTLCLQWAFWVWPTITTSQLAVLLSNMINLFLTYPAFCSWFWSFPGAWLTNLNKFGNNFLCRKFFLILFDLYRSPSKSLTALIQIPCRLVEHLCTDRTQEMKWKIK